MKNEITIDLQNKLEYMLNPTNDPRLYIANEVTLDYGTQNCKRVDYMKFEPLNNSVAGIEKGDFYCFEIKSSEKDFLSPHGHNFIGDFNYYVMPRNVYLNVKDKIPYGIGIYTPFGDCLILEKKAKRKIREKSASELLFLMFRSSNRELYKLKKKERND